MSDVQQAKAADEVFCSSCGAVIKQMAEICPKCGVRNQAGPSPAGGVSDKDWLTTFLLCLFLSPFGVHRFYAGRVGSGILMILFDWLTLFIWNLVDLIKIATGKFKDGEGKYIVKKP